MKLRTWRTLGILAALAIAVTVPASLALAKSSDGHGNGGGGDGRDVQHIFVIMLENHSQQGVIGDPNSPYITSLAHAYSSASNYYGVTHPSEPNYVAFLSGSNWWINNDNPANRFDHLNLVDQLEKQQSWAGYMEAMPADDKTADYWPSSSNALYASKHNPFVLFNDIRNSSARMANVKPYTQFAADLQSERTTPDLSFIVPDQCNDMHGGVYTPVAGHPETPCPYGSTNDDANDAALKQKADAWVHTAVQTIMASPAWTGGNRGDRHHGRRGRLHRQHAERRLGLQPAVRLPRSTAGNPEISTSWPGDRSRWWFVPTVVVTNHGGRTGGYISTVPYNHYSLLATIEQLWHLDKLAYAADTTQVKPMLHLFPH